MNFSARISMTLAALVTAGDTGARGSFNLGTALQRILVPDDADQMAVFEFTLDPDLGETVAPSGMFLAPATGMANESVTTMPPGWDSGDFDVWAFSQNLGTTLPLKDADGDAMDLRTIYALAINATGPVSIYANGSPAWLSGPLSDNSGMTCRDTVIVDPAGWAITGDAQILIKNRHTAANTITIAVLGKRQ